MDLHRFNDIHTHRMDAGEDAVINLPEGREVPAHGAYSVGIHPWEAAVVDDMRWAWLEQAARHANVVAVGECGLDALRGPDMATQERVFMRHVELSETIGKPLIIHAVRTLPRLMQLRKQLHPSQQWIIHGYRGNAVTALQLARLGIGISLGDRYNPDVPSAIPPELLYHETDAMD